MDRLLERIQNQWMKKKPALWVTDLYACDVLWEERLSGMRSHARYSRRIRQTPDKTFLIAENWRIVPGDLPVFLAHWGYDMQGQDPPDWGRFRYEIGKNRIFAVPEEGLICVWRFFPSFEEAWKTPPYSLGKLSLNELTEPSKRKKDRRAKQFLSDVLLEEILDQDGLGLSMSKTWHFKEDFSRTSAKGRLQRRLRLNVNGLYSVFDTFFLGGEFLLGNVREREHAHFYSETGPFLGISKKVTVVHSGYRTWHEALFSSAINPANLPYNEENLRKLPVGMRIIFPHEATLALIAKTKFNYFEDSDITQKLQTGISVKGSVMVSVSKVDENRVVLKVGGRLERLFDAYFDMRPDFDGAADPLRLLFGSMVRYRFEGGRGKRVYLEKAIDLDHPEQVRLLKKAMKNGLLLRGLSFGFRTALYFMFHPNHEHPQSYFLEKIPEIEWDQALLGSFKLRESYTKVGSRPIAFRRSTEMISDDWEVFDYQRRHQRSGYSFRINTNSNRRWVKGSHNRDLLLYGIMNDEFPDEVFITIQDMTKDGHWTPQKLMKFRQDWAERLGLELGIPDDTLEEMDGRHGRIGFRLIVRLSVLNKMISNGNLLDLAKEDPQLGPWLKRHAVLMLSLERAIRLKKRFLLARTVYKMLKKGAPIGPILDLMDEADYRLEWLVEDPGRRLVVQGHKGHAQVPRRQVLEWNWWEEKQAFEEIFVDVSLTAD